MWNSMFDFGFGGSGLFRFLFRSFRLFRWFRSGCSGGFVPVVSGFSTCRFGWTTCSNLRRKSLLGRPATCSSGLNVNLERQYGQSNSVTSLDSLAAIERCLSTNLSRQTQQNEWRQGNCFGSLKYSKQMEHSYKYITSSTRSTLDEATAILILNLMQYETKACEVSHCNYTMTCVFYAIKHQ